MFDQRRERLMADVLIMYYITIGVFAFLIAILFGARAKRIGSGNTILESKRPPSAPSTGSPPSAPRGRVGIGGVGDD